ncbi:hypothetical protein ABMA57_11000 [Saccharospirillum sp. HFRX-1]|uniref:hypothetical protein n=1 Tax=unclassified Saccharospirillum TaxID=2633430 RepID=UPI00371F2860
MKIWIATAAITLAAPMAWSAPLIDLAGSVGYSFNGLDEGTLANNSMDLTSDSANNPAGLDHEMDSGLYATAKIGLPFLPDIGLKYESLVSNGSNVISDTVSYGGESQTYVAEEVESELDMSYLDLTVSAGIPFAYSSLDFGVNFRSFIGGFEAEGKNTGQKLEASFSDGPVILPMLYVAGSFTPPVVPTDLTLSAELKTMPMDTNVTDWNVKAAWFAPLPTNALGKLGVEGGYRDYSVSIGESTFGADTEDFVSEISYSGFFLGATVQF